ncbi:MAG TPA: DUF3326 domain-containing protein [Longimicrobium sp.]|nr:DUF3326 domain-containing protein [Longimicrobium sp.]
MESASAGQGGPLLPMPSIFEFRRRRLERTHQFTAVMLVPTGVDCAIGGHAGDATPAARVLASVCDQLIVHPNVVNASDINEQTDNSLYVEGSLICRLLTGSIALRKVRSNRLLVVTEARDDGPWAVDQVVNSASAARATLGVSCAEVAVLSNGLSMRMGLSPAGRAVGEIEDLEALFAVLEEARGRYDAVALSTRITPAGNIADLFDAYFGGTGPNPWGGVEAALTHAVSAVFNVPSAHAPTLEDLSLRTHAFGQVDPRKAAESISTSYSYCVLKGLHRAPAVVPDPDGVYDPTLVAAEDVSCVVAPATCLGLPTIAALLQGITVIGVRENTTMLQSDLRVLPFEPGRLWMVDSYLEAAGLISALRAGVDPHAVRRPLCPTVVRHR